MWNNGFCEPQCNNVRCGYNDCTASQITSHCLVATDLSGVSYSSPPNHLAAGESRSAAPYPVGLTLSFDPARLRIDDDINQMVLSSSVEYTFNWFDDRLLSTPCAGALTAMLSLSREDAASDDSRERKRGYRDRFFVPQINLDPGHPDWDQWDSEAHFHLGGGGFDQSVQAQELCPGCATYTGDIDFQLLQDFNYFYYPFDNQTIEVDLSSDGVHIVGCNISMLAPMELTESNAAELLLPSTNEWWLNGTLDSGAVEFVQSSPGSCVIRIHIRRNPLVYLVKFMATTILTVLGSILTALAMPPDENMGDRVAALFIAFLILVTNIQTDIGLGDLASLIWLDWFNMIQLICVGVCVFEAMLVHRLFRLQQDALATHIDLVCRWVLPAILYPLITFATLLEGLSSQHPNYKDAQTVIYLAGVPLTFIFTVWRVRTNFQSIGKLQARCLHEFAETAEDSPEWEHKARALFDAFDLDQSGSIDVKEMRAVVKRKYAHVSNRVIAKALLEMRPHAVDGEVEQDSFIDAMSAVSEYVEKHLESYSRTNNGLGNSADGKVGGNIVSSTLRRGSHIAYGYGHALEDKVKGAVGVVDPPSAPPRVEIRHRAKDEVRSGPAVVPDTMAEPVVAAVALEEGRSKAPAPKLDEMKTGLEVRSYAKTGLEVRSYAKVEPTSVTAQIMAIREMNNEHVSPMTAQITAMREMSLEQSKEAAELRAAAEAAERESAAMQAQLLGRMANSGQQITIGDTTWLNRAPSKSSTASRLKFDSPFNDNAAFDAGALPNRKKEKSSKRNLIT